jgi:2-oxoglutarate ferredoxin oxidoreductase subunit beta
VDSIPTTPEGARATTMPYGNIDNSFDICKLVMGAGATFVARTTAYHAMEIQNYVRMGFEHKGFALIEVIAACPVIYGRLNKRGDAAAMMQNMKEDSKPIAAYDALPEEEKSKYYPRGIFVNEDKPEYTDKYAKLVASFQKTEGDE